MTIMTAARPAQPAIAVEEEDIAALGKVLPKCLETGVAAARGVERLRPIDLHDNCTERAGQAHASIG